MSFTPTDMLPKEEMELRHEKCRHLLHTLFPDCGGILVFSRLNIFYLTGTLANGVFWLPKEGTPLLLCRRGIERAKLESPLPIIAPFRSYSDLIPLCAEYETPLSNKVGVNKDGLSWSLGDLLKKKLRDYNLIPTDIVMAKARSIKTPYELNIMRTCGEKHHTSLYHALPNVLQSGMSERDISIKAWDVFFAKEHQGMLRMGNFGEEIFLGHVAAGDNANYPSVFNGPVGLQGDNPASPFMGNSNRVWEKNQLLTCDIGFAYKGYCTDKTQVYFSGKTIPDRIKKAHDFCIETQSWIRDQLKVGGVPSEIYAQCLERAEQKGLDEGFMAQGENKVVFLGHGIGLTIDGYPVLAKGFDEPLEENMTLAVEPKYGIPGLGMCGVENTFLVTSQGGECLTGQEYDIVCID